MGVGVHVELFFCKLKHMIDRETKDNAIDEDFNCWQEWLLLSTEHTIDVNLSISVDLPLPKDASDIGEDMLTNQGYKYGIALFDLVILGF